MYDAIVIGARCAGSPSAMLLARRGFKVQHVDKATFPSDTISTHILWPMAPRSSDAGGSFSGLLRQGCRPSAGE